MVFLGFPSIWIEESQVSWFLRLKILKEKVDFAICYDLRNMRWVPMSAANGPRVGSSNMQ